MSDIPNVHPVPPWRCLWHRQVVPKMFDARLSSLINHALHVFPKSTWAELQFMTQYGVKFDLSAAIYAAKETGA